MGGEFDWSQLLVALGVGGAITAIIGGFFQRGKVRAEKTTLEAQADEYLSKATKTIVESWESTNIALREDLDRTKTELRNTRNELSEASSALRDATFQVSQSNRRFDTLISQLRQMNVDVTQILSNTDPHPQLDSNGD